MQTKEFLRKLRRSGRSIRAYVVGLIVAVLFPALLFGGWLTWGSAGAERVLLEENSQNKARQIVADIEHEISGTKALLIALASSHSLQTEDFDGFRRQLQDVAIQLSVQFVLAEAKTGRHLVNTGLESGKSPPPRVGRNAAEVAMAEAITSGKPTISNVFFAPVPQRYVISVGLPISHRGEITHFLSAGIPADMFADALQNAALPDHWIVTLTDRDAAIVARSERHQQFVGTKVLTDFARPSDGQGITTAVNRLGVEYRWAWLRSQATGWIVAVGVPVSVLAAPAKNALRTYIVASGVLFLAAIAAAFQFGGRLEQSAGVLGIDRTPTKEEFGVLFESAPNGVLVVDNEGVIVLANERVARKFGYKQSALIGKPVTMLFPSRFRHDGLSPEFTKATERSPTYVGRKLYGLHADGSEFPIEVGLNPVQTRNAHFMMATVVDLTARVKSEERLTAAHVERDELRRRLMEAQEAERLRISRELHDQTGQSLTAIMLELKGLEGELTGPQQERVRLLRTNMDGIGKTLHRIALELRPASIDELGLSSALTNYVAEWSQQFGIEVDFQCTEGRVDALSNETRTALYRLVQESLTNVAKHASTATVVSIVLSCSDGSVRLAVEDDGPGFDAATALSLRGDKPAGLGLAGMQERISLIGGEFQIESEVGSGTAILVRVPIREGQSS